MLTVKQILEIVPEISGADMAFPAGANIREPYDKIIPHAKEFKLTWGEEFFNHVFFEGGRVPKVKDLEELGCSAEDVTRLLRWLKAAMGSYYPSQGDKTAVCGMLWEMFFEEPTNV